MGVLRMFQHRGTRGNASNDGFYLDFSSHCVTMKETKKKQKKKIIQHIKVGILTHLHLISFYFLIHSKNDGTTSNVIF